jgi:hypothetical protein
LDRPGHESNELPDRGGYPLAISTSPLSPDDIRAAAEVHAELGPEYRDAVVESFLAKIDNEIRARIDAQLETTRRAESATQIRLLPRGGEAWQQGSCWARSSLAFRSPSSPSTSEMTAAA